jgi:SAM-dependent methyltransferase
VAHQTTASRNARPIDPLAENEYERGIDCGNFGANLFFLERTGVLTRDHRILEIGSGHGRMLHHLLSNGFDVRGVEASASRIAGGQRVYGTLPYTLVTGADLPFDDGAFDVVLSFDVFEHIPDSDRHLREVARVLKPRGHYLLQTPNKWTNIPFEIIRFRSLTRWRTHHCSLHTRRQLARRFDAHGFEVRFHRIPVVNDFLIGKVKRYLGSPGLFMLKVCNPDRLPAAMSPALYAEARQR